MPTKDPQTVEAIDAEILAISHQRDSLRERALELHRQRDDMLRGDRLAGVLDGLSDDDRAALRERLTEHERG